MFQEVRRPKIEFNEGAVLGLPYIPVGYEPVQPTHASRKRLMTRAEKLAPAAKKKYKKKVRLYRRALLSGQYLHYIRPMPIEPTDECLKEF